jgi:hypothetical protein
MTATMTATPTYRTSDMALSAYLKVEGHDCQDVVLDGDTCYWIFVSTPRLVGCIEAFRGGAVQVDLKEYNRLFGATKREFYSLTDALHRR